MSAGANVILYVAIFLGVLLAVEGLVQILGLKGDDGARTINRRLRMLGSGADPEDVLRLLRRKQEPEGFERLYILKHWPALLRQAGFGVSPSMGLALLIGWAVLVFLIANVELPALPALGAVVLLGLLIPVQILRMIRDYRVNRLSQQMPDTIDLMVRSLRAGHPLNAAFQVIAREMPDPIGSEFGTVADAITYGDDLPTALGEMAARVGSEDVDYLAVAVSLQHGTGGNLAAVLQTLSQVIRERFAMRRKIKALSAEGRITAIVVSLVPAALATIVHLATPDYYGEVWNDPMFMPLAGTGIALMVMNALVLRKMVRFHF